MRLPPTLLLSRLAPVQHLREPKADRYLSAWGEIWLLIRSRMQGKENKLRKVAFIVPDQTMPSSAVARSRQM